MKKKLLWVASTLLVLIAVGFLLKHNLQQKRTTDGIDISHHNIVRDWNKVNDNIRDTFCNLGVIKAEKEYLGGVTNQYESEVVYHKNKSSDGVIFLSTDDALKKYYTKVASRITK